MFTSEPLGPSGTTDNAFQSLAIVDIDVPSSGPPVGMIGAHMEDLFFKDRTFGLVMGHGSL